MASTSGSDSAGATSCSGSTPCIAGKRNVCTPFGGVRHLESATRGAVRPAARTSSRATGATSGGSSPATRTSRRTCRSASRMPAAARPVRADARRPDRRSRSVARSRLPPVDRRRRESIWSPTCAASPTPTSRPIGTLHAHNRAAVRAEDHQLVPPRHRQPVLRRHQHRAAHGRPPRRARTASRTASCSGPHPNEAFFRSAIAAAFPALADSPISPRRSRCAPRPASRACDVVDRDALGDRVLVAHTSRTRGASST